jgi:hypothetical protein
MSGISRAPERAKRLLVAVLVLVRLTGSAAHAEKRVALVIGSVSE